MCILIVWSRLFFLRPIQEHDLQLALPIFSSIFPFSSTKADPLLTLLHCPAPENPTHLSRHWVRWVALYIERSQRFDIRRRPQRCNPVNPLPPTLSSSLYFCIGDLLTNTLLQALLAAIVHFYFTKLFKGLISRMKKVGGNKREGGGREQ